MSGYKFREAINDLTKFAFSLENYSKGRIERTSVSQSLYDDAKTKLQEVIDSFSEWRDRLCEDGKEGTPLVESIQDTIESIDVEGLPEFPNLDSKQSVSSTLEDVRNIIEELNEVQFPSR